MIADQRRDRTSGLRVSDAARPAPATRLDRFVLPVSLIAVIAAGFVLAIFWLRMVPIFQSPDENAHFAYAHAIGTARHLLRSRDAPAGDDPEISAFESATGFAQIAFKSEIPEPDGYGTPAFFHAIDQTVHPLPPGYYQSPGHVNPRLINVYPFGFYAVAGAGIALMQALHAGIVEQFYGTRLLCTFMFVFGLCWWYMAIRAMGRPPVFALGITALVALFPLSSFVASYVQPDNLAFALIPLLLTMASRLQAGALRERRFAVFGIALGMLLVTKYQYALCVGLATLPIVMLRLAAARLGGGRKLRCLVWLVVPSAILFAVNKYCTAFGTQAYFSGPYALNRGVATAFAHGARAGVAYVASEFHAAYSDYFFGGNTMVSYWGDFGWLDTVVNFGNPVHTALVWTAIVVGTNLAIVLAVVCAVRNAARLVQIARRRSLQRAAELLLANPAINAYAIFAAFMLVLYVVSENSFGAQGRNWYPFEGAAFVTLVSFAPRALRWRRWRRVVAGTAALFLTGYCTLGSALCIAAVEHRYYHPTVPRPVIDPAHLRIVDTPTNFAVDVIRAGATTLTPGAVTHAAPGSSVYVYGWALDQLHAANGGVYMTYDDRFWVWTTRVARADVGAAFGDSRLTASGFMLNQPLPAQPGLHRIGIDVVSADGSFVYRTPASYPVVVP